MAEYTPSDDQVRGRYCDGTYRQTGHTTEGDDFEAWLARVRRDAAREALNDLAAAEHRATRAEAQSETRRINTEYWRETALQERGATLDLLEQIKGRDARIKAVRELHQQSALIRRIPRSMREGHDDDQPFHYCTGCDGARYPCDTIRALDGDS